VTFAMTAATAVTWFIHHFLLLPFDIECLADHRLHPGDRRPRPTGGDGDPEGQPGVLPVARPFIPLTVVNGIILGCAEAFAARHATLPALADGAGMGVGLTLALFGPPASHCC
jgi:Na+-translocating ferredoxin:NAD+ oxidoreductase RnfA subunit